ncbi:MAG: hypothetical protein RL594_647 [Bacteroidota bacterium]|jgi:ATP-dependent Clp protease adaptor protein ClpS
MAHNTTEFLGVSQFDQPEEVEEAVALGFSARVVLFNDEEHTFDEVIVQIIRATGCSVERAELLTLEVHHTGKAIVFEGDVVDCLRVSGILEEIALRTQIQF